jgi:enamine deaminase RidA (YjgF/YER057c/UK114 family)
MTAEHRIVSPPGLAEPIGYAHGGEPDDLVSLVVYTTDMAEYRASLSELGEVWRRRFGRRYPALALVGASALFEPDARVELMGVAVVRGG